VKRALALAVVIMTTCTAQAQAGWKNMMKTKVNHMQRVMGWTKFSTWKVKHWQQHYRWIHSIYSHPPNFGAWMCIHRYEGAWNSTSNPVYDGGLQMDMTFQRHYGPYLLRKKGTADRWEPLEQIWTAEKARRSGRGFYPWPNTARYCGLL
jgi:hypothetical protein